MTLKKDTRFLTDKEYYSDDTFLSSSALNNFVTFDALGNPIYNFAEFLNPTPPDSAELHIGTYCDEVLTNGKNLEDLISKKMSKSELEEECEMRNIDVAAQRKALWYKWVATIAQLKKLLEDDGMTFNNEVTDAIYTACEKIISRAKNFQYDFKTSFMQYIAECETQFTMVDDGLGMRGKFDFFNPKRWRITDLKTTKNLDRIKKELIFRNEINVYHKYTRQLAIYQRLAYYQTGEFYTCELAIIDHKWHHMLIRIGQEALDLAWAQVEKDIEVLRQYGSKEIVDYAVTLTATPKPPWTIVQNILAEEVEDEEEQLY